MNAARRWVGLAMGFCLGWLAGCGEGTEGHGGDGGRRASADAADSADASVRTPGAPAAEGMPGVSAGQTGDGEAGRGGATHQEKGDAGAGSVQGTVVPVRELLASHYCNRESAGAAVFTSQASLDGATTQVIASGASGADPLGDIDFVREGVLLVSLGYKPTGGYDISLAQAPARLRSDGRLQLPVRITEPAPGAMTTQVITSPCLAVAFPRRNVIRVDVIDQEDRRRFSVGVP